MPKKSVREMSALERQHYSLSTKVFHSTIMGSILLGLVAMIIGMGLYTYALVGQYVSEAFNLSRSAETILRRVVYIEPMANTVIEIYRSLSEAERMEVGSEKYREKFDRILQEPEYQTAIAVLDTFRESSDVSDLYLGLYDEETLALVYIADPATEPGMIFYPGDWEPVESREVQTFLHWDGSGKLYDISNTEKYGWMCTAGVPVRNEQGETVCYVLSDVTLEDVAQGMKAFLIQYAIAMFLAVNLFAFFLTRHMRKTLVEPINSIAGAAQDYVRAKQNGQKTTDFFSMLNIRSGDEIENLSLVMADMERDLTDYVDNLTTITAEKERINTELDLARRIQENMLPNIFPPYPDRNDFNIYAGMNPAKEVGGDFYDFFLLDDKHLALAIADVSGKGIPAALYMMITKILVQNYTYTGRSPSQVMKAINEQICQNNREEMFITLWLGILDLETGELTACNAGHEYPVLKAPGGAFELVKDKHSFIIGGMTDVNYLEYRVKLEPGSKLFLYTDGIPEAVNERDELFGMERTVSALNDAADESPEKILQRVNRSVEYFVGAASQFDDMTMMCLEYIGKKKK